MRILDIRERSVAIWRHRDPSLPSGGLTTSMVAVVTDVMRGGKPVIGWGSLGLGGVAELPGVGFEAKETVARPFRSLLDG
jgi:D(-)-tartrate dehydratase